MVIVAIVVTFQLVAPLNMFSKLVSWETVVVHNANQYHVPAFSLVIFTPIGKTNNYPSCSLSLTCMNHDHSHTHVSFSCKNKHVCTINNNEVFYNICAGPKDALDTTSS